jgi:hypothetical protein
VQIAHVLQHHLVSSSKTPRTEPSARCEVSCPRRFRSRLATIRPELVFVSVKRPFVGSGIYDFHEPSTFRPSSSERRDAA